MISVDLYFTILVLNIVVGFGLTRTNGRARWVTAAVSASALTRRLSATGVRAALVNAEKMLANCLKAVKSSSLNPVRRSIMSLLDAARRSRRANLPSC